jgi:mono/diheme cytochrome c family protein
VAPPLTGGLWLNGPGTYTWLIEQITHGVPGHRTKSGLAMPMRGWSTMSDDEVRAVAAYVWAITRPRRSMQPQRRRRAGHRPG